jgi:hypothetical protein
MLHLEDLRRHPQPRERGLVRVRGELAGAGIRERGDRVHARLDFLVGHRDLEPAGLLPEERLVHDPGQDLLAQGALVLGAHGRHHGLHGPLELLPIDDLELHVQDLLAVDDRGRPHVAAHAALHAELDNDPRQERHKQDAEDHLGHRPAHLLHHDGE